MTEALRIRGPRRVGFPRKVRTLWAVEHEFQDDADGFWLALNVPLPGRSRSLTPLCAPSVLEWSIDGVILSDAITARKEILAANPERER